MHRKMNIINMHVISNVSSISNCLPDLNDLSDLSLSSNSATNSVRHDLFFFHAWELYTVIVMTITMTTVIIILISDTKL